MKYAIIILALLCFCDKTDTYTHNVPDTVSYANKYDSLAQYYDDVKLRISNELTTDGSITFK